MTLLDNIEDIITLKVIASYNKVSYEIAKILDLFDIRKADESALKAAEDLNKIFSQKRISFEEAKQYMKPYFSNCYVEWEKNDLIDTAEKLSVPKEIYECGLQEEYVSHLKMMKKHFEDEEIKTIYESSLSLIKYSKNVSKIAAYYVAYINDVAFGNLMSNAIEWDRQTNHFNIEEAKHIPGSLIVKQKMQNYLLNSGDFETASINNLKIVTDNKKSLYILKNVVDEFCRTSKPEFIEALSQQVKKANFIISDKSFWDRRIARKKIVAAYCESKYDMVVFNSLFKHSVSELADTLVHEATHYIDRALGDNKFYSSDFSEIKNIFNRIVNTTYNLDFSEIGSNKINPNIFQEMVALPLNLLRKGITFNDIILCRIKALEYASNSSKNDKWYNEIKGKHPGLSNESIKIYLRKKQRDAYGKYLLTSLCLSDIYDALSAGKLRGRGNGFFGHGIDYYSDDTDDVTKISEFIADVSEVINLGCEDILETEFGKDIANDLITAFNNFIEKAKIDGILEQISLYDDAIFMLIGQINSNGENIMKK